MKPFFVYMLRCGDGSYYVGHTDDLENRMAQHHDGSLGGHTARRRPLELVWSHAVGDRGDALELELQLKRWTRAKKQALVRGDWGALKRLARGPNRHERRGGEPASPFDFAPGAAGRYAQGERACALPDFAPGAALRANRVETPHERRVEAPGAPERTDG